MKKITNIKLLPTTNPNYQVKESVDELIALFEKQTVYIVDEKETIVGTTGVSSKFYEDDGFICGDIYYREDLHDLTNYEWCNAEVVVDNDMYIKSISNIVYKEKE